MGGLSQGITLPLFFLQGLKLKICDFEGTHQRSVGGDLGDIMPPYWPDGTAVHGRQQLAIRKGSPMSKVEIISGLNETLKALESRETGRATIALESLREAVKTRGVGS